MSYIRHLFDPNEINNLDVSLHIMGKVFSRWKILMRRNTSSFRIVETPSPS